MTTTTRTFTLTVQAAQTGVPTWAAAAAVNTWVPITGTEQQRIDNTGAFCNWSYGARPQTTNFALYSGDASSVNINNVDNWSYCGIAVDHSTSTAWSAANGGHGDYFGNEVYKLDLRSNTPRWAIVKEPTRNITVENALDVTNDGYNRSDGSPVSRHTYWANWFDQISGKVFLLGCTASQGIGRAWKNVDAFNIAQNQWDKLLNITHPSVPSSIDVAFGLIGFKDNDGDVWVFSSADNGNVARFNFSGVKGAQRTWTTLSTGISTFYNSAVLYNSTTNRAFMPRYYAFGSYSSSRILDPTNNLSATNVTLTGAGASAYDTALLAGGRSAGTFDPDTNAYYLIPWMQPKVFKVDATSYDTTEIASMPNVGSTTGVYFRTYGNFYYSALHKGIIHIVADRRVPAYFMRTH
jgi:hypothetical protein